MTRLHPPLGPYGRFDVAAPTGSEAAAFDRRAIDGEGVSQSVLMENAGRSAAQVLDRLFPRGRVVAMVGAGNNGGDALVLLRTLAAWGREVGAVRVADRSDSDAVLHGWDVPVLDDSSLGDDAAKWTAALGSAAVLVDGILGTGIRGKPRPRQARAIRHLNESGRPVLALDVPSGVDADAGATPGEVVHADVTVAFGAPKLGTLLHPGRMHAGRLVAVEIAFPPEPAGYAGARVVTPAWAQAHLPARALDTHKNAVGRLLVVAGRAGMGGAAVLAATGGFRAGAGLVQVCSAPENRVVLQSTVPEAIYVDATSAGALEEALARANAVAVGPGLGTDRAAEELLRRVLDSCEVPLVLDADALNLLAAGRPTEVSAALRGRRVLLTPHAGEMDRLRSRSGRADGGAGADADRVTTVREAADSLGCAVALKGAPSLVASPGVEILVDVQGSSDLAVAGIGDVLTGVCGGLMAQGVAPREAGAVGLYLTGRAATLAGKGRALTPRDVLVRLSDALGERGAGVSGLDLPFVVLDLGRAR